MNATNIAEDVYKISKEILGEMNIQDGIRLIGVRLDNLTLGFNHQTSLFESVNSFDNDNSLEKTVDKIKEKYGFKSIKKASLVDRYVGNKYLNK